MSPKHDVITLDQIIANIKEERFKDLPDDRFFEIFVAEQILKERGLDDYELLEGNPGGAHDGGIDAVHLFINGVRIDETNVNDYIELRENVKIDFHLMQAKRSPKMEQAVIEKFSSMSDDLFDMTTDLDELDYVYNSGIIQAFTLFRQVYSALGYTAPEINVVFSYATRGGKATPNMLRKAQQLQQKIGRLIHGCNCTFDFYSASDLLDLTRKTPNKIFNVQIAMQPLASDVTGQSLVALIRLDKYFEFITDDKGELETRLFFANVRDWQGDTNKVNVQIRDSLNSRDSNDFWWLNNGVTILSQNVTQTGLILNLENPEIVNGLQTSTAIYQHFSAREDGINDDRKLLARIIVVADDVENREAIIKATNSQTAVTAEALRSLDRIHRNIETYFASQHPPLYYDRRKSYYKNLRKPAKSIIGIRQLTQAFLAAVQFKPDDAKGRPGNYLRSGSDQLYLSVFDVNNHPAVYYFCARLYKAVEDTLKHEDVDDQFDLALRRSVRFHVMTQVVLRHLNVARVQISSAVELVSNMKVDEIDPNVMISSTNHVLNLLDDFRTQQESRRIKWREFEDVFFNDLDKLLPQIQSP